MLSSSATQPHRQRMGRRAPITIPTAAGGIIGEAGWANTDGATAWADDYAAPTPSFPLTPQAQQELDDAARQAQLAAAQRQRAAEAAHHEAQQRSAVLLQALSRSHLARAGLAAHAHAAQMAALADGEQRDAAAATNLQAVCRAHLVRQLRAWFAASVAAGGGVTAAAVNGAAAAARTGCAAGSGGPTRRRVARRSVERSPYGERPPSAAQQRQSKGRQGMGGRNCDAQLEARFNEIKDRVNTLAMEESSDQARPAGYKEDISELGQRIKALETQLGRGLGEPETAARRTRRKPRRKRALVDMSASLRVNARPTVAESMSAASLSVPGGQRRQAVAASRSAGAVRSVPSLNEFSAEWSQGSMDGWSQMLPRHRWFQGLAEQLHALHTLADPVAEEEDGTRSYIRDYVERELSHPHRTSGHRMDSGNAIESAAAHDMQWRPSSQGFGSQRSFGQPPELPPAIAPRVPKGEDWVTRLSRRSSGPPPPAAQAWSALFPSASFIPNVERLKVTLRQDVNGTSGFGIVLQCDPSSSHDRRLQPPSQTVVTAVTPGSDASSAGVVAGMAVLSVNGTELPPDTSAAAISAIFQAIVGMPQVIFEFEAMGGMVASSSFSSMASTAKTEEARPIGPEGWCAHAQSALSAAELGKRDGIIIVAWDGGGQARTGACAMCEHSACQLCDVVSSCFKSGLIREVTCVSVEGHADDSNGEVADSGQMWTRAADDFLVRMVPEYTSGTGGRVSWSSIAAKLTGWSQSLKYPIEYNTRECNERWDAVLDPHLTQWHSLRQPVIRVRFCLFFRSFCHFFHHFIFAGVVVCGCFSAGAVVYAHCWASRVAFRGRSRQSRGRPYP